MRGKVHILGRALPAWIVAAALIVASAGAATGVVLAGRVTGTITATASQALLVSDNSVVAGPAVDAGLFTANDDGTGFTATAELNTGDQFDVRLVLMNASNAQLSGELTLVAPDGITLSVADADDVVADAVRTGPFTWKFRLNPAPADGTADLIVTVALADDMPPGFYTVDGTLKQIAS